MPQSPADDAFAPTLRRLDRRGARCWQLLLDHCLTARSARPAARWLKHAHNLLEDIGSEPFSRALCDWLHAILRETGPQDVWREDHAKGVRGLLWLTPQLTPSAELLRTVSAVALAAWKKIPGLGPRMIKVGNAALYALSEMPTVDAIGQLAVLKSRLRIPAAQREIEKSYARAAIVLGLPRDQIEELGVPTYGLESGGRHRQMLGDYTAEVVVTGSDAELHWRDRTGKSRKSMPAKLKSDHAEEVQDLKQSLKDIQAMLPAQRDRIDGMFLQQANWAVDVWRARYLEHPLVGTIASRLIWCVDGTPVLFVAGQPVDLRGQAVQHGKTAEVTLWHPVGRPIDEVLAWRERLEALEITQPFKQAHREVYLLTDAERRTNTYSNRFAAHVLRQHQFHALCNARGWKNRLRLMVDDAYEPPCKLLPQWGLRAEFWVEGLGADYRVDTNDAGVYLRVATDQVRFYRLQAAPHVAHAAGGGYATYAPRGATGADEPLPLDQVPPLVFSEIMRDVDLFVGVASVGNDPTWHDGGPQGRFLNYWQDYSFGDLSGSATTRKQVLERLIPRLKIAARCSFSDRFLVVRGDRRTYKIHLGSGNILMDPNDQYLCIVADSTTRAAAAEVHLPFEGDQTLSLILSKALLLADDRRISDPTIVRQIEL